MAAAKPPKKPSIPPRKPADDDEVLFEGELTWTHEHIPASPELLKRTPRDEQPANKALHTPPPSEGSIELNESAEGGGEIFNNDVETSEVPPESQPSDDAATSPPESSPEVPVPAETQAETIAKQPPVSHSSTPDGHGRTVMPTNDIRSPMPQTSTRRSNAPLPTDALPGRPNGPTTGEFAPSLDPNASPTNHATLFIGGILLLVILLIAGGIAYIMLFLPNQPSSILKQALGNSLQKHSAQVELTASNIGTDTIPRLALIAKGGISQAGSYNATVDLRNTPKGSPLHMEVRSIDGSNSYVQFGALAANQAYMTKLGIPPTAPLQNFEGKWLLVPSSARSAIFSSIGLDSAATLNADSKGKQALAALYGKYPFLSVAATLPDATIDKVPQYYYRLALNKTQLTAFLIAAKTQVKSLGITQRQIDYANNLDTAHTKMEIWIAKSNKMITQLLFARQNNTGVYAWQMKFSHYDETLSLQQPTAQTDVVSALKSTIGPTASDADGLALLQRIASNYAAPVPARQ